MAPQNTRWSEVVRLGLFGVGAGLWLACSLSPEQASSHAAPSASVAPPSSDAEADGRMAALCRDPIKNADAARWFAALGAESKRAQAARGGVLLLETPGGQELAFACGTSASPYPWVLICSAKRLELSGDNTFALALRDDEFVRSTWGVHWTWGQSYDVLTTESGPVFAKRPSSKGQAGGSLWIPATSWKYVGPALARSPAQLEATDMNRGP